MNRKQAALSCLPKRKAADMAEQLRGEIAELKAQGESDRIDFQLQLAVVRNVKAARAILGDYDGDVDALKAAEPWLFADARTAKPQEHGVLPEAHGGRDVRCRRGPGGHVCGRVRG